MAAGERHGIRPFGLEAQRILRLEKQHILVGQDTDAESDPFEVGLGWTVKADKDDFLGKRGLEGPGAEAAGERLVGFTCEGSWVPPEGSSVVHDGIWVGRVTSARASAAAGEHRGPRLGAPRAGRTTGRRSRSSSAATARRRWWRCVRSTTPRARGSDRERADPPLAARRACTRTSAPCWNTRRAGSSSRTTGTRPPNARRCASGIGLADVTARGKIDVRGSLDGALSAAGDVLTARIAEDWALAAGRTRWRGGPRPEAGVGGRTERDGDRRDASVRRVRARGAGAARRARPADLVGPGVARGGRGDRRADRRRPSRRGRGATSRCRCSRPTSRPSSRATPGRRCSTPFGGRVERRSAGARSAPRGGRSDASDPATSSRGRCGAATT